MSQATKNGRAVCWMNHFLFRPQFSEEVIYFLQLTGKGNQNYEQVVASESYDWMLQVHCMNACLLTLSSQHQSTACWYV